MMAAMLPRIERPTRFGSPHEVGAALWISVADNVYQCRIAIEREGNEFVGYARRFPDVSARGATPDEVADIVAGAFVERIQRYVDAGLDVPWGECEPSSHDLVRLVHVGDETTEITSDTEFMRDVRNSIQEFADGETRSWESVKDELGL